ncbi:MAG: GIY-YIG nuclease family protein [Alcanivoracaceae bacterium]|nr:GIY-YIG nuclease family protein [Alcanivoracaceae bacterium]
MSARAGNKEAQKPWSIYLVRASDNSLYCGIATDVARRFKEHQEGGKLSAKYLRARTPLTLCYHVVIGNRSLASRAEYRVKKLTKAQKEVLVAEQPDTTTFLEMLGMSSD